MSHSPRGELVIAALCTCFGIVFLFVVQAGAGIPARQKLEQVSGAVTWIEVHRHGVRFGLAGDPRNFDYDSKAGESDVVNSALESARARPITVLIDPTRTHGPIHSDKKYFTAWEVRLDGRPIRSYEETTEAWLKDDRLAPWLGAAFLACGLFLGIGAIRRIRARPGAAGDGPRPPDADRP